MDKFSRLKPSQQEAIRLLTMQDIQIDKKKKRLTYEQIADKVGVSSKTLLTWRTEDKAFVEAREQFTEAMADELLSEAYGTLRRGMKSNNVKAAEVFLKSRGKLVEKTVADISVTDKNSVEEKQKKLDELRIRIASNDQEDDA